MADVTVKYKGSTIAEMSGTNTKTLKTAGTYCEGDITVDYAPRCKIYEITLAKSSGWVLLTTLDDEVLAHINDANFVVTLKMTSDYAYTYYAGNTFIVGNTPIGYYSATSATVPVYGQCNRTTKETSTTTSAVFYPANKTDTTTTAGGNCMFRISGNKYYIRPGDGYVYAGTYRLTFTW